MICAAFLCLGHAAAKPPANGAVHRRARLFPPSDLHWLGSMRAVAVATSEAPFGGFFAGHLNPSLIVNAAAIGWQKASVQ